MRSKETPPQSTSARDNLRHRLYEEFARVGQAVSSPVRFEIIEILAQSERTVEALALQIGQPFANTSHHLQALREVRLVETRKEGLHVHYQLADPAVFELCRAIRNLAQKRLAEVDRIVDAYLGASDGLEPVGREELLARVRGGDVVVLDVRPAEEFRAGHIPGAVSVPLAELERRMKEFPIDGEIIAYCRGPYCIMAFKAVELLRAGKRRARRLVDGFPEWKAEGLPVEVLRREDATPPGRPQAKRAR